MGNLIDSNATSGAAKKPHDMLNEAEMLQKLMFGWV